MSVQAGQARARRQPLAARIVWGALLAFLTAFAALEVVNHGWPALAAAVLFFAAPDLTMLIGAPRSAGRGRLAVRAVPYYNAVHRAAVPSVLLVLFAVGAFGPLSRAPVFAALLGWLAHIALDRTAGRGLRTPDGGVRTSR
jgi:hypothetical protein